MTTTKRGRGVAVRVESVGGRVQRLYPGVRRAEIFSGFTGFALRWRVFVAPFVAAAPCRDLVAKTRRDTSYPVLRPYTRILMQLDIGPLILAVH
jgi:hypothetical protein